MAISLQILDGNGMGATFPDTGYGYLENYVPQTPEIGADSVTETIEVTIGFSGSVKLIIGVLERIFQQARDRQAGAYGLGIAYMVLTLDSDVWRSPILDGKIVVPDENWLKYEWALLQRKVSLIITREPWWEDNTERQIPITGENGPENTTGLNIYNCNDLSGTVPNKRSNYLEISSLNVLGDLPAPLRIDCAIGSSAGLADLMISENIYSGFSSFIHWYEGVLDAGNPSNPISDATCSGGSYLESAAGPTVTWAYAQLTTMVPLMQSGFYRLLARMSLNSNYTIQPMVAVNDNTHVVYGKNLYLSPGASGFWWWDLGILPIPPNYVRGATYLAIFPGWLVNVPAGLTWKLDCWMLAPLDGWKRIVLDQVLTTGQHLMINEIDGVIYGTDSSGKLNSYIGQTGNTLMIYPAQNTRFYMVWNTSKTPTADITSYLTVKMYYRPRRRTL